MALQAGGVLLTPTPERVAVAGNYINDSTFSYFGDNGVELPDAMKENFEIYGNRTIASFLRAASAEYPCASDVIKWSEEGRLHTLYTGVTRSTNTFEFGSSNQVTHNLRVKQTVLISDGSALERGMVESITDKDTVVIKSLEGASFSIGSSNLKLFVYGSEFEKGSSTVEGSLEARQTTKETSPIIIREKYSVNGSDMAQIGWVEVSTEGGGSGYLWYLKSQNETRLRFDDYLEMSMVESVETDSGSTAPVTKGHRGLISEIETNGNVFQGVVSAKADFDSILKRLDKQGAILENMFFADRDQNLAIDDFLASQNSYGAGGTSYGAFNNSEKMALNLGFFGFQRGSYEFYKTDWKYLNDATTRGSIEGTGKLRAIVVPSGTKTVYDQVLGKKIRQPFLHVKYRKSAAEDRKYKTWVVGSAGGASNSEEDAMNMHFLSERALVTIGANNFVLVQD